MPHAALTEVPTRITAHVREGRGGTVVPVKGYEANRLKGEGEEISKTGKSPQSEKVSTEEFQQEYDKVENTIFDQNGELRDDVNTNTLESHVKNLFTLSSKSGVDPVINSSEDFLNNVYEAWNKQAAGIDMATASSRDVMSMLLDKENLSATIKTVDSLQSMFEHAFDIKTDRVDPFTFKFNHSSHLGVNSQTVREKLVNFMKSKAEVLAKSQPEVLSEDGLNKVKQDTVKDGLVDCFKIGSKEKPEDKIKSDASKKDMGVAGENAQNKSIGASAVAISLGEYNAPSVDMATRLNFIDMLHDHDIDTMRTLDYNSDKIRSLMTKTLKEYRSPEYGEAKSIDDIADTFSKLNGSDVVPAFHLLRARNVDPKFMLDHPEFMKDVRKISDGLRQNYLSARELRGDIFVSRNPMNILTMSPEKGCQSCQSLTEYGSLNIQATNINVPASYNTQATNDFIMYTMSKEGNKNARMSLSYNDEYGDFASHEEMAIYGDSRAGRELLNRFTDKHDSYFVKGEEQGVSLAEVQKELPEQRQLVGVKKGISRAEETFWDQIYNYGSNYAQKTMENVKTGRAKQEAAKGEIANSFLDGLNRFYYDVLDEQKSLLYGSKADSLVRGSGLIVDEFKKVFKGVDTKYKEAYQIMSDKLAEKKSA